MSRLSFAVSWIDHSYSFLYHLNSW